MFQNFVFCCSKFCFLLLKILFFVAQNFLFYACQIFFGKQNFFSMQNFGFVVKVFFCQNFVFQNFIFYQSHSYFWLKKSFFNITKLFIVINLLSKVPKVPNFTYFWYKRNIHIRRLLLIFCRYKLSEGEKAAGDWADYKSAVCNLQYMFLSRKLRKIYHLEFLWFRKKKISTFLLSTTCAAKKVIIYWNARKISEKIFVFQVYDFYLIGLVNSSRFFRMWISWEDRKNHKPTEQFFGNIRLLNTNSSFISALRFTFRTVQILFKIQIKNKNSNKQFQLLSNFSQN